MAFHPDENPKCQIGYYGVGARRGRQLTVAASSNHPGRDQEVFTPRQLRKMVVGEVDRTRRLSKVLRVEKPKG